MSIQGISVVVDGEPVHAEALDLISGILLLRIAGARPVARGERIEASVLMPGSGSLTGTMIGIDGPLVRFEPGAGDQVLAPGIAPAPTASAPDPVQIPPPVKSVLGPRPAAVPAVLAMQPSAPGAPSLVTIQPPPSRRGGVRPVPLPPSPPPSGPPSPAASPGSLPDSLRAATGRRLEERAPARVSRAVLADALLLATGRNEVPKRVALLDISVSGGVVRGLDISPGRKIMFRFELIDNSKLRVLGIAGHLSPAGLQVSFQYDSPQSRKRLAEAIATKSLRSTV